MKAFMGQFKLILEIGNHHHLDCMMLCQIVTDADTNFTTFAPINGNEGSFCGIVIENGVRFRTKLGTEPAGGLTTDCLIDMCD